jgi:hypothetical protein
MITFTLFVFSFVSIILFILLKVWENNTERKFISQEKLNKGDEFVIRIIRKSFAYFDVFYYKTKKIGFLSKLVFKNLYYIFLDYKNILARKIVDMLGVDNIKNVERNKGSVSLFLRNISNEKKGKKHL